MTKVKNVPVETVEPESVPVTADETSNEIGSDLGSDNEPAPQPEKVDFANLAWLIANNPIFNPETTSKKFDAEREPKVQAGLVAIATLMPEKINALVLLLGKHWECKPARATIKDLIDAEAAAKGIPADRYLQIELRKNVDMLSTIQQAVDRLRYAITYFKPRSGVAVKDIFKTMTIDGIMYRVNMTELENAKLMFGEDKVALKAHLVGISELVEVEEL